MYLFACVEFWRRLVAGAADSPELYTRTGFQLINFLVQYFWAFLLILAIAVALEWALFRGVARLLGQVPEDADIELGYAFVRRATVSTFREHSI